MRSLLLKILLLVVIDSIMSTEIGMPAGLGIQEKFGHADWDIQEKVGHVCDDEVELDEDGIEKFRVKMI
ncbi:hypothetical protein KQX54_004545 [Cotesia glomerata]|uniref:Uncharacterized protein n=1 Tax=Cotesia glomerata TaxID=32391 RepID=A0AAV7IT75_COTGL|nr:hypothetical protein KQX54_004545 [Cotesia glomerata]